MHIAETQKKAQDIVRLWISTMINKKVPLKENMVFLSEDPCRGHFTSHGGLIIRDHGINLTESHWEQLETSMRSGLPDILDYHKTKEGFVNITMNESWVKRYLLDKKKYRDPEEIDPYWVFRLRWLFTYHWSEKEVEDQVFSHFVYTNNKVLQRGLWALMKDEKQEACWEDVYQGYLFTQWLEDFEKTSMIGRLMGEEKIFVMHLYYASMNRHKGGIAWKEWETSLKRFLH